MSSKYTLSQNGDVTDWMNMDEIADPFVMIGKLTGTITIGLEIANDIVSKSDAIVVESYTVSFAKVPVAPLPRRLRLRVTSVAGGNAIVSFGLAIDAKGNYVAPRIEGASSSPSNNF